MDALGWTTLAISLLALVAAGYGVGFSSAAHLAGCHQADVVVRPLADEIVKALG